MQGRFAAQGRKLMLTDADVKNSIARGVDFLKETREPYALLFMNIIHRRFGIEAFADALERYDAVLAEHTDRAPVLRVMRRIADADNPLQPDDWEHVTIDTDRLLVSALYCDRIGLPDSFAEALDRAVSQGGYGLTHALLAWIWVQDNRCDLAVRDGFLEDMYGGAARIIDEDPTTVNDLKLEAGAFLCLARQSARVDLHFVRRVIAFQNKDGGWGPEQASHWHPTILALIIVLHVQVV